MQHARASFVRSGAPGFTKGQQTLIEQISATLCALEINRGGGTSENQTVPTSRLKKYRATPVIISRCALSPRKVICFGFLLTAQVVIRGGSHIVTANVCLVFLDEI